MLERLAGADRRSIGDADAVAQAIAEDQVLFDEVFAFLAGEDPVVRMRAADAVEKASRIRPERLAPHKAALLSELACTKQHEVRWHVLQMLPRLALSDDEKLRAAEIAESCLHDSSAIVRVNALQAFADLAKEHAALACRLRRHLAAALGQGSPAEQARARKILRSL